MRETFALLGVLVVGSSVSAQPAGPGPGPAAPFVGIETSRTVMATTTMRFPGRIVSLESVTLTTRVSADLMEVGFQEGSFVKRGQLLYRMDATRYAAEVTNLIAKIAQAKARFEYSQQTYNRVATLFQKKVSSQDALESAQSDLLAQKGALASAEASLVTAEDDLKHTEIYAPIAGKIGLTTATVGNYLTPSLGSLATIVRLDPVRVKISLANRDYMRDFGGVESRLQAEASIQVRLADDSPYGEAGTVEFVDNSANKRTDTVQVYIRLPNPEFKLLPGSTVTVLLSRKQGAPRIAITPSAVLHDGASAYVYVVDAKGIATRRDVVEFASQGNDLLLTSGLSAGERVVYLGTQKVTPGSPVSGTK
jgi:membrane fusion protein (multidrug efflux system)